MSLIMCFFLCAAIFWMLIQECILLPPPNIVCQNFGSFSGNLSESIQCCLDKYTCPVPVNTSMFDQHNLIHNSRYRRSSAKTNSEFLASSFLDFPKNKTKSLELNLCEVRVSSLQPVYGTRAVMGDKIQILQVKLVLTQNVVIHKCVTQQMQLIRGECVQQYKPEELYTVSTDLDDAGETIVIVKREFINVESGCRPVVIFEAVIPDYTGKPESNILPSILSKMGIAAGIPIGEPITRTSSFTSSSQTPNETRSTSTSKLKYYESEILDHKNVNFENSKIEHTIKIPEDQLSTLFLSRSYLRKSSKIADEDLKTWGGSVPHGKQPSEKVLGDISMNITKSELSPTFTKNTDTEENLSSQQGSSKFVGISTSGHTQAVIGFGSSEESGVSTIQKQIPDGLRTNPFNVDGNRDLENFGESDSKHETSGGEKDLLRKGPEFPYINKEGHLQEISNKIGLPLFIHSFEFDPVKNLMSS